MKRNYQKELEMKIEQQEKQHMVPTLLLHSCCAPCSSYVLEYLSQYFQITVFYYNPNIYPDEEYYKRVEEQKNFIQRFSENAETFFQPLCKEAKQNGTNTFKEAEQKQQHMPEPEKVQRTFHKINFIEGNFDKDRFYEMAKGMEELPEGGERCFQCYELRLREAAQYAKRLHMDYFTTTLSISPMKNAEKLNEIGEKLAAEYGIAYLTSDFKKKNGYKRSVELSGAYGMYRQDYCGCVFSRRERELQKQEYRVLQIIEPDFGCEGIMEGQKRQDTVYLENMQSKEKFSIKASDEILYEKNIEEASVINGKMLLLLQKS